MRLFVSYSGTAAKRLAIGRDSAAGRYLFAKRHASRQVLGIFKHAMYLMVKRSMGTVGLTYTVYGRHVP